MPGRSIRVFLVDGVATGLRTAELGLSTIKALVVPRASLSAATSRSEVQRTGVYILIGKDVDRPGVLKIYVGEGDVVLSRLSAHDKDEDKDFWEEAVVLVSKDENLTKAHGRYLESRLIGLASEAKRCTVANATRPPEQGRLPEADQVEMEEFITQARLLLGTLGYDLFSPMAGPPVASAGDSPATLAQMELVYSGAGYSACCVVDPGSGQFVVKKDSVARSTTTNSMWKSYKELRERLIEDRILVDTGNGLRFTQDYAFPASSTAAAVVAGMSINGRTAWRLKSDPTRTYADWQESHESVDPD